MTDPSQPPSETGCTDSVCGKPEGFFRLQVRDR